MFSKIFSASLFGINADLVQVETDFISNQLPGLTFVGLTDQSIKESKERIWSALINSGFDFPKKRITINLSPSNIIKSGSQLDLAIALGLLVSSGQLEFSRRRKMFFIGELGLDSSIHKTPNVYSYIDCAVKHGFEEVYMPFDPDFENYSSVKIFQAKDLKTLVDHLSGKREIEPLELDSLKSASEGIKFENIIGQNFAKRSLEIAAAGGHSIMMNGSPGSGKTILARAIQSILPDISLEDLQEIKKINSKLTSRPFREPHNSITLRSFIGGGIKPEPGEVTFANNGVLFLDEFNLFDKNVINSLRKVLDHKRIKLNKLNYSLDLPCNFLFVSAINPCPCGKFLDEGCNCPEYVINRYIGKIPGPIMDRIDMYLGVKTDHGKGQSYSTSKDMKERVINARIVQKDRYKNEIYTLNSEVPSSDMKYLDVSSDSKGILDKACIEFNLSTRAYFSILKISRTIADLENSIDIKIDHLMEALQYRTSRLGYQ